MFPPLDQFLESPVFSTLDRHFARFIAEHGGDGCTPHAAALASYQLQRGQVFLELDREPVWEDPSTVPPLSPWPGREEWIQSLRSSRAVGAPGETRPLILTDGGRLYLQRYWVYEKELAEQLRVRFAPEAESPNDSLDERLDQLFENAPEQKDAARNTLHRKFSLISGGPGTGKTTTVLKILALLLETEPETDLAIHLAAPTGKAAARLQESILNGIDALPCSDKTRGSLPRAASTIHRLLKPISGSVFFHHRKDNPLPADVVVIDEASMIDLPLMAKLVTALPPACRIILLGDKDQLASVEAGSVLGGIVEAAAEASGKGGETAVSLLTKNFRFGNDSGVFQICNAIRDGNPDAALEVLRGDDFPDGTWKDLPECEALKVDLARAVLDGYREFLDANDPAEALNAFDRFRILTAVRKGPFGKETVNTLVQEILREEGLLPPGGTRYSGLPLLVTENDYTVGLYNGDVGVLLNDDEGKLAAFFRTADGGVRAVSPLRVPFAEPAFAMTVHKAQGSEFDSVLLLLPDRDSRILTRELLYTAVSRTRRKVEVWAKHGIFKSAVERRVDRRSGLAEILAGD